MSYLQKAKEWEIKSGYRSKEADPYKTLFDEATAELNKDYPAEVLPFIKKNHSKLNDAINTSERKLDQLWDKAPIEEFREELKTFYKLNLKSVKLYREEQV
jgi:hypothetical protein